MAAQSGDWKPKSDEGVILGRLVEDELREKGSTVWDGKTVEWESCWVGARVTPDDERHAKELATMLADALAGGDRDVLDKLPHILALLRGMTDRTAVLWNYGSCIASCVEHRERDLSDAASRRVSYAWACSLIRDMLINDFDPAFAKLTPERIAEALLSVATDGAKKGGAHNRGSTRIAAELACAAGAFGFSGADADALESAQNQIAVAMARHKKRQQSKAY